MTPSVSLLLGGGLEEDTLAGGSTSVDNMMGSVNNNNNNNNNDLSEDPMAKALDSALELANNSQISEEEIVAASIEHDLAPPPPFQDQLQQDSLGNLSSASFGYNVKKKKRKGKKKKGVHSRAASCKEDLQSRLII